LILALSQNVLVKMAVFAFRASGAGLPGWSDVSWKRLAKEYLPGAEI